MTRLERQLGAAEREQERRGPLGRALRELRARGPSPRAVAGLAAAAVVVIGIVIGTVALTRGGEEQTVDEQSGTSFIKLDHHPDHVVYAAGSVWTTASVTNRLTRIDPDSGDVQASIAVGAPGGSTRHMSVAAGSIWVSDYEARGVVRRIDPDTNRVVASVRVGRNPTAISADADAVWVSNFAGGSLSRIDPKTDRVVDTIALGTPGDDGPHSSVRVGDRLWVMVVNDEVIAQVDTGTGDVVRELPFRGCVPVAAGDSVWVAETCGEGTLARISAETGRVVARIDVGQPVRSMAVDGRDLWVTTQDEQISAATRTRVRLLRIDTRTNRIVSRQTLGPATDAGNRVAVGGSAVWVGGTDGIWRISTDEGS